ncbi:hypothetical protein [Desulfomarina sp.]
MKKLKSYQYSSFMKSTTLFSWKKSWAPRRFRVSFVRIGKL